MAEEVDAKQLVFVDEMGANVSLSALYAWSRKGKRALGRGGGDGQSLRPQGPQGRQGQGDLGGSGLRARLPATLLAGLQPHRASFSKVKGLVRRAEARTREALIEAMGRALSALSAMDAWAFFAHCGYREVVQPL